MSDPDCGQTTPQQRDLLQMNNDRYLVQGFQGILTFAQAV